jgi:hypothetical protein
MTGPATARRDLGRRLAGVRKAAGYTQLQLGAAAGYSRSTVSNADGQNGGINGPGRIVRPAGNRTCAR